MGAATFTTLAVEKVGLYFSQPFFPLTGFAAVDVSVTNNEGKQSAPQQTISKRTLCWLAIGLPYGAANAFFWGFI